MPDIIFSAIGSAIIILTFGISARASYCAAVRGRNLRLNAWRRAFSWLIIPLGVFYWTIFFSKFFVAMIFYHGTAFSKKIR